MLYSINKFFSILKLLLIFTFHGRHPVMATPMTPPVLAQRPSRWIWCLLLLWLVYSLGMMGWYFLNDPLLMASICRTR